jgi:micrococcal nuclease
LADEANGIMVYQEVHNVSPKHLYKNTKQCVNEKFENNIISDFIQTFRFRVQPGTGDEYDFFLFYGKLYSMKKRLLPIFFLLSVLAGIFSYQGNVPSKMIHEPLSEPYHIIRVVDGDTIIVQINSKKETVRLIGLDTPEIVDPRKPVECFGKESSEEAKRILAEKSVQLKTDPSQALRDTYHRLLAYVFLEDGTNFNELMIKNGYGYEYTYDVPYAYQKEFKQAEKYARENKRGLWSGGVCGN